MGHSANLVLPPALASPLPAARVLIVEDDQIVAVDLEGRLERLGYQVVDTAASGEEACAKVGTLQPDLILMDVRLAGPMDGIEAAQRIRQISKAPIVFLTAHCDAATLDRAKQAEPYGYLVKPLVPSDLHATLQMALYKGNIHLPRGKPVASTTQNRQVSFLTRKGQETVCCSDQRNVPVAGVTDLDPDLTHALPLDPDQWMIFRPLSFARDAVSDLPG